MTFKVGTCNGHYEFLEMIRRLAKSNALCGTSTYTGTGNGTMSDEALSPNGSNETWLVTCIDVTTTGQELWSVTGSVSGTQTQYTTGELYHENDISFKITAGGTAFVLADQFTVLAATYTGTGDGTIDDVDCLPAGVTETITVTCTDATTPGSEVWSVVGSVTGAHASATTGVAYTSTPVTFTITAGGVNFAVNDAWVIYMVQGELAAIGEEWVEERYVDTVLDGEGLIDLEMILRGPGLSGTEQIYAAFTSNQSIVSDYYNISLSSMIGYVDGDALSAQPSYSGLRWIPMWNQAIRYWVVINGQRIAFGCKVETHYWSGYVGKYFPYATPTQFPYPICVLGTNSGSTERYSATHTVDLFNTFISRLVTGTWGTTYPWPFNHNYSYSSRHYWPKDIQSRPQRDTEGDYPLNAVVPTQTGTYGALGDLDGIFHTSGFNSAVENIVQAGGLDYVKIANNQATGFNSYFALRLD